MTIKPTSTRVFPFTLHLHVIVHLRMESNFGMDRRRDDPLQGQAQLRASRCCIATLGRSLLLLLTRNCNSSPFCSVHIVLSYVQFVHSSWFKIVLSLNWKILQFLPCLIQGRKLMVSSEIRFSWVKRPHPKESVQEWMLSVKYLKPITPWPPYHTLKDGKILHWLMYFHLGKKFKYINCISFYF
jgi:hypothetical protein